MILPVSRPSISYSENSQHINLRTHESQDYSDCKCLKAYNCKKGITVPILLGKRTRTPSEIIQNSYLQVIHNREQHKAIWIPNCLPIAVGSLNTAATFLHVLLYPCHFIPCSNYLKPHKNQSGVTSTRLLCNMLGGYIRSELTTNPHSIQKSSRLISPATNLPLFLMKDNSPQRGTLQGSTHSLTVNPTSILRPA